MKKIMFITICVLTFFLTGCGRYSGDNINTPFIEISPKLKNNVELAFLGKEIITDSKQEKYSIDERKKNRTINWQENQTKDNIDDYHFWFTCYYEKDEMVVFHVEKTLKGREGGEKMITYTEYDIAGYVFKVFGPNLENYTYILVYKDGSLYELQSAYDKEIIDDNDVKEIYKHYIDSKFLKMDADYQNYIHDPENRPEY